MNSSMPKIKNYAYIVFDETKKTYKKIRTKKPNKKKKVLCIKTQKNCQVVTTGVVTKKNQKSVEKKPSDSFGQPRFREGPLLCEGPLRCGAIQVGSGVENGRWLL